MKKSLVIILLFVWSTLWGGTNTLTVNGNKTFLNGNEFLVAGLRCSNALISDEIVNDLINHLDEYKSYGVNTISIYFMGSRFGDVKGYNKDGSLNPVYSKRMAKIIKAADDRGMVVLVGCLYWGTSTAKYTDWTQADANSVVYNTVQWLSDNDFRNVFVDPDNEGMARRAMGFNVQEMIVNGKKADSTILIAANIKDVPPPEADLGIHFCTPVPEKPYIETEATPKNAPGRYWGTYSKHPDVYNYINIGVYTDSMKIDQIQSTKAHFEKGYGYMMASTWLQCVSPHGPNANSGGSGSKDKPGIRWWLEALKEMTGPWSPYQP